MDRGNRRRVGAGAGLLVAVARIVDRQRLVALAEQDFDDLEAVVGDAAAEVEEIRRRGAALVHREVAAHFEAGQREAGVADRVTAGVGRAVGQPALVGVGVVRVEHVQRIDAAGLARRVAGFLAADRVGLVRQQHRRAQRPIRACRSKAAFDDERPANLLEILVLRREGLEHAVGAGERRVRADVDGDPLVPVGHRERERVFVVGLGARLDQRPGSPAAELPRNVCLSVRIVSVTLLLGALVSRTR